MEPSFGGINLEDIKAPECFVIEQALRERMKIPVMHDDQHGTAIISAAGLLNACHLTGRDLKDVRMRSEEHTSELQSLMRISYAVYCLNKNTTQNFTSYYNNI